MNLEYQIKINQEKNYEIEARKYFVEKIFPTKIFQNYIENETGVCVITERDEQGTLKLPKTEYNPLEKNIHLDANNQLSIKNLSAVTRLFKDWWINNEDYSKNRIELSQLKLWEIQFNPVEKRRRQNDYETSLKEYEKEKDRGLEIANQFLEILEKGKEQETLFEKTRKELNRKT